MQPRSFLRTSFQNLDDPFQNPFALKAYSRVPEPQDPPSEFAKTFVTDRVIASTMLLAIDLDDEPCGPACEVDDETVDRYLPPELEAVQSTIPKLRP